MRLALLAVLFVPVAAASALACIWDDDTVAMENKGAPLILDAIAGKFGRNPPLYYEMRLARIEAKKAEDLTFPDFDNAGVACDRLGRGDDAIAWMERKKVRLDAGNEKSEKVRLHRYRHLANLGTFIVHRWLRQGGDRARIAEVKRARDRIEEAIELNPDAHFGRERYQLAALDWLVKGESWEKQLDERKRLVDFLGLGRRGAIDIGDNGSLRAFGYEDALAGLPGLISLGNAWESVDVFYGLVIALQVDGRSTLSYLAELRCRELVGDGRKTLTPGAPTGDELIRHLRHGELLRKARRAELEETYRTKRAEADAWQKRRLRYMMERLEKGEHPDMDDPEDKEKGKGFWSGFKEL